jgi:hypothetical protein
MPHFFLKLIAPRPTFAMDMTGEEKALMKSNRGFTCEIHPMRAVTRDDPKP